MAAAARMTGLQAYQRNLKLILEDARRQLTAEEWETLQAILHLWLSLEKQRAA